MKVLGIDPGSRTTGWGIVEGIPGGLRHIDNGNITPSPKLSFHARLFEIYSDIRSLIEKHSPDACAVENIFVAKNVRSSLILGHARGSVIIAATSANLHIGEYTPAQVKKALSGTGTATKEQIQRMVQIVLGLPEPACEDASDALAVAICHLNCAAFGARVSAAMRR